MEWIKVSDRLPDSENILIYQYEEVAWGYFSLRRNKFYGKYNPYARIFEDRLDNVTHWMPLPEPPNEL